jgi:hypothetical protein
MLVERDRMQMYPILQWNVAWISQRFESIYFPWNRQSKNPGRPEVPRLPIIACIVIMWLMSRSRKFGQWDKWKPCSPTA